LKLLLDGSAPPASVDALVKCIGREVEVMGGEKKWRARVSCLQAES
jgi:hypothetical protein